MSQVRPPLVLSVVSESPVVSAGLTAMLEPYALRIVVDSSHGRAPQPGAADVLLLDVFGHPDPTSRVLQLLSDPTPVLVFGRTECLDLMDPSARVRIVGFLGERADGLAIVTAVEAAATGRPTRARAVPDPADGTWPGHDAGLTAREADVLGLVVAGLSNQDVADRLFLSINSVKSYIRSAYRKMGVTSRSQAVLWGLEHGFQVSRPSLWHTEAY